jgi:hypothetical protein
MCYEGVKGPCPANEDNHGVLRVAQRHATSLHSADPGPNPVQGTYSQSPYTKTTYDRSMGTNQVFLGHANTARVQQLYEESFEQAEKAQAMYDQPTNRFLHEDSAGHIDIEDFGYNVKEHFIPESMKPRY